MEPGTENTIKALVKRGQKNLMLIPIAFVNDHIETLHELDIEYAKELGEEVCLENGYILEKRLIHKLTIQFPNLTENIIINLFFIVHCVISLYPTTKCCARLALKGSEGALLPMTTRPSLPASRTSLPTT